MSDDLGRGPRYQARLQHGKVLEVMKERQYAVWDVLTNKIALSKDGGRIVALRYEEAKQLAEEFNAGNPPLRAP
jgi:hypothetical protein